jgi:hypothetical protein
MKKIFVDEIRHIFFYLLLIVNYLIVDTKKSPHTHGTSSFLKLFAAYIGCSCILGMSIHDHSVDLGPTV